MASKSKLRGSFGSLADTLAFRFDPRFPADVAGRWLGVMGFAAAVGQRHGAWTSLPAQSPTFDPIIAALDDATHRLVVADDTAERLAALAAAEGALDLLNNLLDQTGQ